MIRIYMGNVRSCRPIAKVDFPSVREVYSDAIYTQCFSLYTNIQVQTWASLAWLPDLFQVPLNEGRGWLIQEEDEVAAFALRYPCHRLAMLYCRGQSSRKGYATALLERIENEAVQEGLLSLATEASLLSYPLLLRCGWILNSLDKIEIGGVGFDRYRMIKSFNINF